METPAERVKRLRRLANKVGVGLEDYSNEGSFSKAYSKAREKGLEYFKYKNRRYNTQYKGSADEQFKKYGNTNKTIASNLDKNTKIALDKIAYESDLGSFGESLDKVYTIHSQVGNPRIHMDPTRRISKYNPFTNAMILRNLDMYPEEAAHAAQSNLALRSVNDWFRSPYISEEGYQRQYKIKGSMENQAHDVIAPQIWDLLIGRKPINKEGKTIFSK